MTTPNGWSSDTSIDVVLSNGDKTATGSSGVTGFALSTQGHGSGKWYYEATAVVADLSGFGQFSGIGIASGSFGIAVFVIPNGDVAGTTAGSPTVSSYASGDVLGIALDVDASTIWFRTNGGIWNNDIAGDPATGVGGLEYSGPAEDILALFVSNTNTPGTQTIINTGPTFATAKPIGFDDWVPSGFIATGTISATSTFAATGKALAASVGTITAQSALAAFGAALVPSVGTMAAQSTFAAVGASTTAGQGVGSVTAVSAFSGVGASQSTAVGTMAAVSSFAGLSAAITNVVGTVSAASQLAGVGIRLAAAVGSIAAVSDFEAVGTKNTTNTIRTIDYIVAMGGGLAASPQAAWSANGPTKDSKGRTIKWDQ